MKSQSTENKALENKECHYIRIGDDVGCHLPKVQFATKRGQLVPTKPRFNKRRQHAINFTSTCNAVLSQACFDFLEISNKINNRVAPEKTETVSTRSKFAPSPSDGTTSDESDNILEDEKPPPFELEELEIDLCSNSFPKLSSIFGASVSESKMSALLEEIVRLHKTKSRSISFHYKNDSNGLLVAIPQTKSRNYNRFRELTQRSKWLHNILIHIGCGNCNKYVSAIDEGRT